MTENEKMELFNNFFNKMTDTLVDNDVENSELRDYGLKGKTKTALIHNFGHLDDKQLEDITKDPKDFANLCSQIYEKIKEQMFRTFNNVKNTIITKAVNIVIDESDIELNKDKVAEYFSKDYNSFLLKVEDEFEGLLYADLDDIAHNAKFAQNLYFYKPIFDFEKDEPFYLSKDIPQDDKAKVYNLYVSLSKFGEDIQKAFMEYSYDCPLIEPDVIFETLDDNYLDDFETDIREYNGYPLRLWAILDEDLCLPIKFEFDIDDYIVNEDDEFYKIYEVTDIVCRYDRAKNENIITNPFRFEDNEEVHDFISKCLSSYFDYNEMINEN